MKLAPKLSAPNEKKCLNALYKLNLLDTFVSPSAHQLRIQIAAINWCTELLLDGKAGKLVPKQKLLLQDIYV